MSSRGRGYGGYSGGRGSYSGRSSGYRGSYRGSGTRGSYEGRGGRGGGYSSYNTDSRYNSSSGTRYSTSRDSRIDDSYKKPYRSESSTGYSSREYGRSGSPDRKRIRIEGSSSERRSHEGGHYGSSYGRQESYSGERRSFGGEDRRRSPARDSYRKSSGMGPPRELPRSSMRSRGPRRSFRGRIMRSRATYRGALRSRGVFAARRYADRSLAYVRAFRSIKSRSSPVKSKDEDEASSTEEDWDADEKDEEISEEKKEKKAKSPKADGEASEGHEEGAEAEETDKEADEAPEPPPRPRLHVRLVCVHCKEKAINFIGYNKHLLSRKHRLAMSAVAARHKAQLVRMRVAQRGAQRELEAAAEAGDGELAMRSTFCLICRLNYRTTRAQHNLSDTHRAMKRFLMPFCRVCRLHFRSPMLYEHHICSVEHLKMKARNPLRRPSPKAAEGDGSGEEGMDVDLDNFMTLDSVGDVDEVEDEDSGAEKKEEEKKKPKVEINIGSEHLKKVEVWWCELCKVSLPVSEAGSSEEAEARRRHCRMRLHLSRYVQHRDTRTLRKQAERIHRQLHRQKEEEKAAAETAADKVKEEKPEPSEEVKKKLENGTDAASASGEDKMWADVDKDLGDLLSEVDQQGNEGSDDEDELNRYDKVRKTDKSSKTVDGEENEESIEETVNEKNGEVNATA